MEQRSTQPDSTQHRSQRERDIEDLVNYVQQIGAIEYTSYVNAGLLCRRYLTWDGSIDLTVRVK